MVSPPSIDLGMILPGVPSPMKVITVTANSDISDLAISLLGDDLTLNGRAFSQGEELAPSALP